jgi:integrase
MAVYRRGKTYWFNFIFNGEHVQESTHKRNRKEAENVETIRKARLLDEYKERENTARERNCKPEDLRHCADCGNLFNAANPITSSDGKYVFCSEPCEQKWRSRQSPTPKFSEFAERFGDEMSTRHRAKPKTATYYANGLKKLKAFFGDVRLDRVTEEQIAAFVAKRRALKKKNGRLLTVATVNRELEVLRRMLRLAQEWNVINRVPKISINHGAEVQRERVLDHGEEQAYLAVSKQPLRDVATLILDGGFRPEEVFRMSWEDVNFRPAGKAAYGYVHVPIGKTKYARRNVSMTARVKALLEMRHSQQGEPSEGWVFAAPTKSGRVESLKSQHKKALTLSKVRAFVLYSLRHTMLTRLGEAGADAFAIQKIAGHSSILISQRYVHPTPERIEGAFTLLESYNAAKETQLKEEQERERATTTVQ